MKIRKVAGALFAIGFFGILASCEKTIAGPLIERPSASPRGGIYASSNLSVQISGVGTVYYFTNGGTTNVYSGAINLSDSTTLYSYSVLGSTTTPLASNRYLLLTNVTGTSYGGAADGASSLVFDKFDNLYWSSSGENIIYRVNVSTMARTVLVAAGTFSTPVGMAIDQSGNLIVCDYGNHKIRSVNTNTGAVTHIAGNGTGATADGTGVGASFKNPSGVAVLANGDYVISEASGNCIRLMKAGTFEVTRLAGSGTASNQDGTGTGSTFFNPWTMVVDANDNIYVCEDFYNHIIRKVTPTGAVTTYAGAFPGGGSTVGAWNVGTFYRPMGLAIDPASGDLLVASGWQNQIRVVRAADRSIEVLAGQGGEAVLNGPPASAKFGLPTGVAISSKGNVYVAEYYKSGGAYIRVINRPSAPPP